MKILVVSDSHSSLYLMRGCIKAVKPDCLIHLGDYYDDGRILHEENPDTLFYQVPGNCDCSFGFNLKDETLLITIAGVKFMLTHGHRFRVKSGLDSLISYARDNNVNAVMFGHTHIPLCSREADGIWVLNPGAAGVCGGSAGVIDVQQGKISACRIIGQADFKDFV